MKFYDYEKLKRQALRVKRVKRAYDALEPEFEVIRMIIKKRIAKRLTQAELARRIGTKQSAVSRLEQGTYNPSLRFLQKVADALDAKFEISFS
ncbi:MAG: helix-turn-helix transcriptional regulator [Candidatus Doudnabacteria bacterium]|nr:helix-turn-helix transcriptional regulator [Candidatus Doudnabacteria bacterium]